MQDAMNYVLSEDVTTIPSAGEPELLDAMLDAARNFEPMTVVEQRATRDRVRDPDQPVPLP